MRERWEEGGRYIVVARSLLGWWLFSGRSEVTLWCVVSETEYLVLLSVCLFVLCCVVLGWVVLFLRGQGVVG